jgi:hypothetical protein
MTSAAASALASAPAILELAEASRWRAPEVTAVLAEHAAQLARDRGDPRTALLAEGWLAQGLFSLGHGVAAVPRAVSALSEATRDNQGAASDRLRVALAGVARSLDDRSTGLVLLAPVLEAGGTSTRLHADAHLEAVLCRDAGSNGAGASGDVAFAALREVGGEYGELGLAAADAALASQLRARRQLGEAVEYARSGLRRMFGDQPAGGPLQPVSPYLAATLGLELTLALLDQGQQDAALESARLVMRWDVQPGSLVSTARLQLALAQRVYLPAGARDEASAAVEWVARAVARRELPEIEVECFGLLAELRERGGELSEALAASRQGHAAYRALASAVERAVVLLVRAAGEVAPAGGRDLDGPSAEAGPPDLADQPSPPVPAVGHATAAGQASARAEAGLANGTKPPWMTSAGPAWRPSVETARHPGSVTPRRSGADSLAGAGQGAGGRTESNVYRLFEGGGARAGEAGAAGSEPKTPHGPSDLLSRADPLAPTGVAPLAERPGTSESEPPAGSDGLGAHPTPAGPGGLSALGQRGGAGYDLRASLETTDPLLGRTLAGELHSAGRGGPFDLERTAGPNGTPGPAAGDPRTYSGRSNSSVPPGGPGASADPFGGSSLGGPGPATTPDVLGGAGPLSRFDRLSGSRPASGVAASQATGPLSGSDPLSGDRLAGPGPLTAGDPFAEVGRRAEPDPLFGDIPWSGHDPRSGSDLFSDHDPLSGPAPLSGYDPLSGSDPLGGAGPTAALGAVPSTSWQAAAERLVHPARSIGGGSLGGPEAPVGLSIAQLAIELLGLNTETGQPPHLVLIDIATPDGSATGPEVAALTGRIASRVREQLPPAARLYLVEQDAVAVALPEVDPEAVTRWVRTVSTGLSLRWSELAAELPRAVFRIDVRALDRDRTIAEQLWDLRIGQPDQPQGGPDSPLGGPLPGDGQQPPPPPARHVAGTIGQAPVGVDLDPNRINAQPGSGGRRRRPGGGPGSASDGKAIGQLGLRRQDTPSAGPAGDRLTSRHRGGPSAISTGGPEGFRDAGGVERGASGGAPGVWAAGYSQLIGTPIARLTASVDQPSAAAETAHSPEPGRIALAEAPRPDDRQFADHQVAAEPSAPPSSRLATNGSVANGSAGHGNAVPDIGALRLPNGSVLAGLPTVDGSPTLGVPTNGTVVNGVAVNGVAVNGSAVNGAAVHVVASRGTDRNGAAAHGVDRNGVTGPGRSSNGAAPNGAAPHGSVNGTRNGSAANASAVNGSAVNGSAVNGSAVNGSAVNGSAVNGSAVNGTAANGSAANGARAHGSLNGAGNRAVTNGTVTNGAATNGSATNGDATRGAINGFGTNGAGTNGVTNRVGDGRSTNGVATNGTKANGAAAPGATTGAEEDAEATGGGADPSAKPSAGANAAADPTGDAADPTVDADPVGEREAGHSGRSRRRNGRAATPRGAAPDPSTPVSELSFAELIAGALAAYRET